MLIPADGRLTTRCCPSPCPKTAIQNRESGLHLPAGVNASPNRRKRIPLILCNNASHLQFLQTLTAAVFSRIWCN